ncbi:MAG: hypothetical protein AB1861_25480 [Cyanobacteriota bacterium]
MKGGQLCPVACDCASYAGDELRHPASVNPGTIDKTTRRFYD